MLTLSRDKDNEKISLSRSLSVNDPQFRHQLHLLALIINFLPIMSTEESNIHLTTNFS